MTSLPVRRYLKSHLQPLLDAVRLAEGRRAAGDDATVEREDATVVGARGGEREAFMRQAVSMSAIGAQTPGSGPIGAVIVSKTGEILAVGHSQVGTSLDPTAHAEVVAIREAARRLGKPDLDGATLYTSVAPCPMCLAASHWANIGKIYYAISTDEADAYGFPDRALFEDFAKGDGRRSLPVEKIGAIGAEAHAVVQRWLEDASHRKAFGYLHRQPAIRRLYSAQIESALARERLHAANEPTWDPQEGRRSA